jgi:hypothetical protein
MGYHKTRRKPGFTFNPNNNLERKTQMDYKNPVEEALARARNATPEQVRRRETQKAMEERRAKQKARSWAKRKEEAAKATDLKNQFWAHIEPSAEGYGRAIDFLLNRVAKLRLPTLVREFCGESEE